MSCVEIHRPANDYDYQLEQWNYTNPSWTGFDDEDDEHPEYFIPETLQYRMENDVTLSEHDKMIIQRLACRKFHIPGHSYWEDYIYWFCNNHPIMCFFYADPRHPLGRRERVMNLVSSLAFGLAATCSVALWFYYNSDTRDFNRVLFSIFGILDITSGMLALILFSGPLHVLFDLGLFFLQSCPPCRAGGLLEKMPESFKKMWLWVGAHLAFLITVGATSLAINVMLIRASIADGDGDDTDLTTDVEHYSFVGMYILEVLLANFIVFPLGSFTVFSGVLGCGVIPGIGGRPYQVKKHARMLERKRKKLIREQEACKTLQHPDAPALVNRI